MKYALIIGVLFVVACGPSGEGSGGWPTETAKVAPGETCGHFPEHGLPYHTANCEGDGWCMPETVQDGGNYGICIDVETDCSQGGTECPDGWGCKDVQPIDACLRFCESHSDCPSIQVCDYMTPGHGYCRVRPCLDSCPTDTSCSEEHQLCVAD